MAEIQSQKFVQDIKQFNCPNCGNQLQLINKKTKYVGCNYCGTVSDPKSEVSKIIMKLNSPSKYPPFSFLSLGVKAKINGYEYRVIGRTRWQTTHMEYWKEGYYQGYGTEKWVYDEWLLMGERFDYFYIVEDAEGFYISKNIIPANPSIPTVSPVLAEGIDPHPTKPQPLNEVGSAKVLFFEGETTYQIKPGDMIHYASYNKNGTSYVIEWRTNNQSKNQYEITEVEFFEEKKFTIKELKNWFQFDEEAKLNIFLLFDRYLWTKKILGWASVICLLLAFIDYQPTILRQEILPEKELLKTIEFEETVKENFTFDSVYVQEVNGENTYPLTEDMIDASLSYSELKDPNLMFAVLAIDTTVMKKYKINYSTYKSELPKYPIKFQPNTNYYFNFYDDQLSVIITDKEYNQLDEIKTYGWYKWADPIEGFVIAKPKFSSNSDSKSFGFLIIQKELYNSFGMLIASFVLVSLWILYLPISEWVFRFKPEKK